MDLMSDIGSADQLTSAREENKVLKVKVKELSASVKDLTLRCATLQAEVEIYRKEAGVPSFSNLALGQSQSPTAAGRAEQKADRFIASGNNVYPCSPCVSLPNLHGPSNPLCCSLDPLTDSVLATGGADGCLSLATWGSALAPGEEASRDTVRRACTIKCDAPVISVAISPSGLVAGGCMDGSVRLASYTLTGGGGITANEVVGCRQVKEIRHSKYVKFLVWSHDGSLLATGSADGTVQFSRVTTLPAQSDRLQQQHQHQHQDQDHHMTDKEEEASPQVLIQIVRTLHLTNAVEAGCFLDEGSRFCLYERGTPYLAYFDLDDDFKMSKQFLNGSVTGGFDEHVSFAIMHLCPSPDRAFLCAATDSSRNIILEVPPRSKTTDGDDDRKCGIVRDLYGHSNDGYSQPRVAWSKNGQYVFGTTQEDSSICVWDISSASIVRRLGAGGPWDGDDGHRGQIRDIFSSSISDTLVTASFDKTVKVWLRDM